MKKICKVCKICLPINCFEKQIGKNGKFYYRNECKKCRNKRQYKDIKNNPEKWSRKLARNAEKRWDPDKRATFILSDSKLYDKKHNLENNLDKEFIDKEILKGCSYCGTFDFKIGLDRIDNNIGHMKDNVIAACTRCNFIRRDMPYKAWILLVPKIKEAAQKKLFDGWTCGFNHHKRRILNEK